MKSLLGSLKFLIWWLRKKNKEIAELREVPGSKLFFKKCGHIGPEKFKFNFYGQIESANVYKQYIYKEGGRRVVDGPCPKCEFERVKKTTIRCALCGAPIFKDAGVALYSKNSKRVRKDIATFVGDNVIGCLAVDCCPSGGFFAGYWKGDSFKPAFKNGSTMAAEVMIIGESIIVKI
jgi:hypothetical protein